jgi:hypothetical protein
MRAEGVEYNRTMEAAKEYVQDGGNLANTLGLLVALARSGAYQNSGAQDGGDTGAAGGSGAQVGG